MKRIVTVILGLFCLALAASLFVSKRNSNTQHESDAEAIASTSNLLSSAQTDLAACKGNVIKLSNLLVTSQSTVLTISNGLMEAKSAFATAKEALDRQIRELNLQITKSETEKQTLSQRISNTTDRLADLTNQIASAQASLLQASEHYALLENRFRRDVAERVIVERKFNNRKALKAQMESLEWYPGQEISEDRIREGLNVVVGRSNLCYVIAPE